MKIETAILTTQPAEELSCVIGNLFYDLEPPCNLPPDPESIVLYGHTVSGRHAKLQIMADVCIFTGDLRDLELARQRCLEKRCQHVHT